MSKALQVFVLHFCNLTGLLCLRLCNGKLKVSGFQAAGNFLKIVLSSVGLFVIANTSLSKSVFRTSLHSFDNFSRFASLSIILSGILTQSALAILFCIQIIKRKKVEEFLNDAIDITLNDISLKFFKTLCLKHSVKLVIYYSFIFAIKFIALVNPTAVNFLAFVVLFFPFVFTFTFVSFIKTIEDFFVTALRQINTDLKKPLMLSTTKDVAKAAAHFIIVKKHHQLRNLSEKFNEAFGLQLTIAVSLFIVLTILNVSF